MNLILLEPGEEELPLPLDDHRARHIVELLKAEAGRSLTAGIVNGPRGRFEVSEITGREIRFRFIADGMSPPLHPVHLVIGAPRPLVTGRLLKDLTALGVGVLHFVTAELCERSYLESRLWKTGEYVRYLKEGAEQSVSTLLPEVRLHPRLADCLDGLPSSRSGIVLDPEEMSGSLRDLPIDALPCILAIGPERGWTRNEVRQFADAGFRPAGMGERILRTEAACLLVSGIVLSRLGLVQARR